MFVLGDNRNNSAASNQYGPVPFDHVVGQAFVRVAPHRHRRTLIVAEIQLRNRFRCCSLVTDRWSAAPRCASARTGRAGGPVPCVGAAPSDAVGAGPGAGGAPGAGCSASSATSVTPAPTACSCSAITASPSCWSSRPTWCLACSTAAVALVVSDPDQLDRMEAGAPHHGWTVLDSDRHQVAGDAEVVFLEDPAGFSDWSPRPSPRAGRSGRGRRPSGRRGR